MWPYIVSINEKLSTFASNHKGVEFFNADRVFIQDRPEGKFLKLNFMQDPVHPNLTGHMRLNAWIKRKLHDILGDDE